MWGRVTLERGPWGVVPALPTPLPSSGPDEGGSSPQPAPPGGAAAHSPCPPSPRAAFRLPARSQLRLGSLARVLRCPQPCHLPPTGLQSRRAVLSSRAAWPRPQGERRWSSSQGRRRCCPHPHNARGPEVTLRTSCRWPRAWTERAFEVNRSPFHESAAKAEPGQPPAGPACCGDRLSLPPASRRGA